MAIKIDFTQIKVYTDITRTESSVIDARVRVADDLYRNGQGIAFHALALKIYNSKGEEEYTDEEYNLLMSYANSMCTPVFIDALKSYKENNI